MGYLSFTEKDWDKARPFAVKKTGVSEAINAFEKVVPNKIDDLTTTSKCKVAVDLLETLSDKFDGALKQMDKKKHEEAIKTVGRWKGEITSRQKAINEHSAKLRQALTLQIEKASETLDPFYHELSDLNAEILGFRSNLEECAKQAVLAVSKNALDDLPDIQHRAQGFVTAYSKLLVQVEAIPKMADKSLAGKLPNNDDLEESQKINRTKVINRNTALQYTARDISEMKDEFLALLDRVMTAQKQAGSLEDKFVKIVEDDATTCRAVMKPITVGEAAVSAELKMLQEILEKVQNVNTSQEDKTKLSRGIAMGLKGAVERVKTFRRQVDELENLVAKKTGDYPDFVTDENEKFKKSLQVIIAVKKFNSEMKTKTLPDYNLKIKNIVQVFNNLPQN